MTFVPNFVVKDVQQILGDYIYYLFNKIQQTDAKHFWDAYEGCCAVDFLRLCEMAKDVDGDERDEFFTAIWEFAHKAIHTMQEDGQATWE